MRTWQMIKRHGLIPAVELVVSRRKEAKGYTALVEMGREDMAFEAVVLRHPEVFSPGAVERSKERLRQLTNLADESIVDEIKREGALSVHVRPPCHSSTHA